jgi:hypothetical protein
MKRIGFLGLLSALLIGSLVRADHTDPQGSIGLLDSEADELVQEVQYSNLNSNVKYAVYDFGTAVHRLVDCVKLGRSGRDHTDEVGCPARCRYQLQYAQSQFSEVSRYLRDTQYDYPYVYRQWRSTSRALSSIYVDGPGPGPGPQPLTYVCVARDSGWEEHFGGHKAYGRSVIEAQRNALTECKRHHGNCLIQSCN